MFALVAHWFNVCACCALAAICTFAYRLSTTNGDRGFCVLFGFVWAAIALMFGLMEFVIPAFGKIVWLVQGLDTATNFMILAACFALYKGPDFKYDDPHLQSLAQLAVILILLVTCSGFVSNKTDLPTWHIFANSAGQILACSSLIALGVVLGRRLPGFATPLRLICAYYALLQVPGSYVIYVQQHADVWYAAAYGLQPGTVPTLDHVDAKFIGAALGAGKLMFVLCTVIIYRTINTAMEKAASLSLFLLGAVFKFL
jgi:hypothetical protein